MGALCRIFEFSFRKSPNYPEIVPAKGAEIGFTNFRNQRDFFGFRLSHRHDCDGRENIRPRPLAATFQRSKRAAALPSLKNSHIYLAQDEDLNLSQL